MPFGPLPRPFVQLGPRVELGRADGVPWNPGGPLRALSVTGSPQDRRDRFFSSPTEPPVPSASACAASCKPMDPAGWKKKKKKKKKNRGRTVSARPAWPARGQPPFSVCGFEGGGRTFVDAGSSRGNGIGPRRARPYALLAQRAGFFPSNDAFARAHFTGSNQRLERRAISKPLNMRRGPARRRIAPAAGGRRLSLLPRCLPASAWRDFSDSFRRGVPAARPPPYDESRLRRSGERAVPRRPLPLSQSLCDESPGRNSSGGKSFASTCSRTRCSGRPERRPGWARRARARSLLHIGALGGPQGSRPIRLGPCASLGRRWSAFGGAREFPGAERFMRRFDSSGAARSERLPGGDRLKLFSTARFSPVPPNGPDRVARAGRPSAFAAHRRLILRPLAITHQGNARPTFAIWNATRAPA